MTLKFANQKRTAATFNGASFSLAAPEDWHSIGDGPTREAVLAWLAAGNKPQITEAPNFVERREAYFATDVRPKREIVLGRLMGIAFVEDKAGNAAIVSLLLTARQRLLDITKDADVLAAANMDDLKSAVIAFYRDTASTLPERVQNAFNAVLDDFPQQ